MTPAINAGTDITTPRLALTALSPADADETAGILDDERLHEFIGERPASLPELRVRYATLAAGSGRADEVWLNWVVRLRDELKAIGTVQATIRTQGTSRTALVAWTIGSAWQNNGYASEAAGALITWLRERGILDIHAHIHPEHRASERVALRAGLEPSDEIADDERIWRLARD